jgi:tryptophan synthase beta chain
MALDDKQIKIVLEERYLPTHWYNVVPDLPSPPHPHDARATESIGNDDILVQ